MIAYNSVMLFFCIMFLLHDAAAGDVDWCLVMATYAGYFQNEIIKLLREKL